MWYFRNCWRFVSLGTLTIPGAIIGEVGGCAVSKFKNMKYFRILQMVGIICGFTTTYKSFRGFYRNIDKLNTPEEWRFYFTFAGFLIFLSMFLFLMLTLFSDKFLNFLIVKFKK